MLSQTLTEKWLSADYSTELSVLDIDCLNGLLDGATFSRAMRKPFDVLVEGLLVSSSRDDRTAIELFLAGLGSWDTGVRRQLGNGREMQD
ncbi:MAG: hypothetical protein H7062_05590 [Candidatus Saccharimonas sp.]|nr:hypothetical protein [Planctomycetaceae bacterium]